MRNMSTQTNHFLIDTIFIAKHNNFVLPKDFMDFVYHQEAVQLSGNFLR